MMNRLFSSLTMCFGLVLLLGSGTLDAGASAAPTLQDPEESASPRYPRYPPDHPEPGPLSTGTRLGDDLPWPGDGGDPTRKYNLTDKPAGASATKQDTPEGLQSWVDDNLAVSSENKAASFLINKASVNAFDSSDPHTIKRVRTYMTLTLSGYVNDFDQKFFHRNMTGQLLIWEETLLPPTGALFGSKISSAGALDGQELGYTWHLNNELSNAQVDFKSAGGNQAGVASPELIGVNASTQSYWVRRSDQKVQEVNTGWVTQNATN
jgi:hypothetical protein